MKLWKLDQKLKSFALVGSISVLGVVNTLQFVSPPKDFFAAASWTTPAPSDGHQEDAVPAPVRPSGKAKVGAAAPVLLVVGVGQEMRTGRWVSRKGEGHVNGAVVFALHPRT